MENKHILVFLAEGFEETEAIATIDVLRRGRIDVRTVSVTGDKTVKGAHAIPVVADYLLSD
ncbi:MAG: DJ-1/PfpI family protein, partial [Bacteroidales bacterium]